MSLARDVRNFFFWEIFLEFVVEVLPDMKSYDWK
jgi:hypothetical protein